MSAIHPRPGPYVALHSGMLVDEATVCLVEVNIAVSCVFRHVG
jgi:hypothetical protein